MTRIKDRFEVGEEDAPAEQQLKIFNGAGGALKFLRETLAPEEVVAAIATMLALHSGEHGMDRQSKDEMLIYVGKTTMMLSPAVRDRLAEFAKQGAH